MYDQLLLTMCVCHNKFSLCTREQVYIIVAIKLLIFITREYMNLRIVRDDMLDNRGVQIIEIRIIEVGL